MLYGALGLAGWWAYTSGWFNFLLPTETVTLPSGSVEPVPPAENGGSASVTPPITPPPLPPATPVLPPPEPPIYIPSDPVSVKQQVLAAGGPMSKSFWQWNAVWMGVTGNTDAPDPFQLQDFSGKSAAEVEGTMLTLDQWWSYMGQFGLSGRGLGAGALPARMWMT